jgi:hypothetical protein
METLRLRPRPVGDRRRSCQMLTQGRSDSQTLAPRRDDSENDGDHDLRSVT